MTTNVQTARPGAAVLPDANSAVSWGAIIAGSFVAAAFSIALLVLGAGIGLGSISPWSNNNPSVTTFGILTAVWLIAIQLFASGIGGYLAGRLRTRWIGAGVDEVFFRDTAHGLVVWGVGAVVVVWLSGSLAASAVQGAGHLAGAVAQTAASTTASAAGHEGEQAANPTAYFTDMLFRSDHPATDQAGATAEAGRVLAKALASGSLPDGDKTYLAQLVSARTGLSQPDAEKRVNDVFDQARTALSQAAAKAKEAADAARKTGVYVALWGFVALLVGALSASGMAAVGGQARDEASLLVEERLR